MGALQVRVRICKGAGEVPSQGEIERAAVAGVQRIQHGLMFGVLVGEPGPPRGRAALHPGHEQTHADPAIRGGQQPIAGEVDQGVVELAVQRDVVPARAAALGGQPVVRGRERTQRGAPGVRVGKALQDGFAGGDFEREPHRPELVDVTGGGRAHMVAVTRDRLDEPVRGQQCERFPDGRDRYAQSAGEFGWIEPARGSQVSVQDCIQQLAPHGPGDGFARPRHRVRRCQAFHEGTLGHIL
jgi:hypothetical protein